jgi:MFS transporter, putative metabolite transport protein
MSSTTTFVDDAPLNAFHKRLTAYSAGGPFLDGYALTIIGIAFITMTPALGLTPADIGLIAASALAGIFVGGAVFGRLTDRFGRKVMYIADLIALTGLSIATAFATEIWQVVALRFLLGIAIGADYPIASSLLAEFVPSKYRGRLLGSLFVVWAVGAAAAAAVGWALSGLGPDAWRWMLASAALFGIITLALRLGTPESPRWLLSRGRVDEAEAVVTKVWGPGHNIDELREAKPQDESAARLLRQPRYLKRLAFVGIFYTAHVIPLFAIYSFGPDLLHRLGVGGGLYLPELIISALFVAGGVPGLWLVDRFGRLPVLNATFVLMAASFAGLALWQDAPPVGAFTLLAVYAVSSGASNFIEIIVPNELFPTSVRATATGIVVAFSRVGSVISTFALPLLLATSGGLASVMWILAAVNVAGLIATVAFGNESKGLSLAAASGVIALPIARRS